MAWLPKLRPPAAAPEHELWIEALSEIDPRYAQLLREFLDEHRLPTRDERDWQDDCERD